MECNYLVNLVTVVLVVPRAVDVAAGFSRIVVLAVAVLALAVITGHRAVSRLC